MAKRPQRGMQAGESAKHLRAVAAGAGHANADLAVEKARVKFVFHSWRLYGAWHDADSRFNLREEISGDLSLGELALKMQVAPWP